MSDFHNVTIQIPSSPNYLSNFVVQWPISNPGPNPNNAGDVIDSIIVLVGNGSFNAFDNVSPLSGLISIGYLTQTGLNPTLPSPFQFGEYFYGPTGGGSLGGTTVLLTIKR